MEPPITVEQLLQDPAFRASVLAPIPKNTACWQQWQKRPTDRSTSGENYAEFTVCTNHLAKCDEEAPAYVLGRPIGPPTMLKVSGFQTTTGLYGAVTVTMPASTALSSQQANSKSKSLANSVWHSPVNHSDLILRLLK